MSNTDASGEKRVTGTSERREQIIQRLRQQGSVQVNDLSALYGVSTVTIRNDLAFLEKQGIAVRAYGGALICDSTTPSVEPSVEDKSALNTAMKRSVAKAAVELIQPGHRVILDSGTTTFEIARLMRKHTDVIAMTNGMNVANALLEAEGVELLMTGGHLRRQSQSFYGDQAEQSLQNYHFDMLFLGVDAIDLERRTKSPTLLKKVIQNEIGLENLGEELRVLYVALTRAKEKLILTGTVPHAADKLEACQLEQENSQKETLDFTKLARATSYYDWILPAAVRKTEEVPIELNVIGVDTLVEGEVDKEAADYLEKEVFLEKIEAEEHPMAVTDERFRAKIEEAFSYRYPYQGEDQMKMKYTVSELKKYARAFRKKRDKSE